MAAQEQTPIAVYLEVGQKKTFAGALDWPAWCRSGRDEAAAFGALVAYAPRYAATIAGTGLAFTPPGDPGALAVAERLDGTSATDFGVAERARAGRGAVGRGRARAVRGDPGNRCGGRSTAPSARRRGGNCARGRAGAAATAPRSCVTSSGPMRATLPAPPWTAVQPG